MKKLLFTGIACAVIACTYAGSKNHSFNPNTSISINNLNDTLPDSITFKKIDTSSKIKTYYKRDSINWKNKPDSLKAIRRKDSVRKN